MSELLANWLNRDLQLSRPVRCFGEEFANGFLIGEVLTHTGLLSQAQFQTQFHDKQHPNTLVANFSALARILKHLSIDFSAEVVRAVMACEQPVILRLLYQIKMLATARANRNILSATTPQTTGPSNSSSSSRRQTKTTQHKTTLPSITQRHAATASTGIGLAKMGMGTTLPAAQLLPTTKLGLHNTIPNGIHKRPREAADRAALRHTTQLIIKHTHNQNHKQKAMDAYLHKFQQRGMQHAQIRAQVIADQEQRKFNRQQAERQRSMQLLRDVKAFREDWEAEAVEKWAQSREITAEYRAKRAFFKQSVLAKQQQRRDAKRQRDALEVARGIDEVVRNLEHIGLAPAAATAAVDHDAHDAAARSSSSGHAAMVSGAPDGADDGQDHQDPESHMRTLRSRMPSEKAQYRAAETYLKGVNARVASDRHARKERERRRRKILANENQGETAKEEQLHQELLLGALQRESQAERRLAAEAFRAGQYREIIVRNRAFRDRQVAEQREKDYHRALERDRVHFEAERARYEAELQRERDRYENIRAEEKKKEDTHVHALCRNIVGGVADLAWKTSTYRALQDTSTIDSHVWNEWIDILRHRVKEGIASMTVSLQEQQPSDERDVPVADTGVPEGEGESQAAFAAVDKAIAETVNMVSIVGPRPPASGSVVDGSNAEHAGNDVTRPCNNEASIIDHCQFDYYMKGSADWQYSKDITSVLQEAIRTSAIGGEVSTKRSKGSGHRNGTVGSKKKHRASVKGKGAARRSAVAAGVTEDSDSTDIVEASVGAAMAQAVESVPIVNSLMGSVVDTIIAVAAGKEEPDPPPQIPKHPISVVFVGKPFAGKSTVAQAMARQHGLEVLCVDDLVQDAVNAARASADSTRGKRKAKKGSQVDLGHRLERAAKRGHAVSDDISVALVVDALHRLDEENDGGYGETVRGGWILDGFPETKKQAMALEHALSGFKLPRVRKSGTPRPVRPLVKSRVAPPPEEPARMDPYPSALSIVLRFDVDNDAVLRRCKGRRMDTETGRMYHMDTDPPNDDELVKEHLVSGPDASATATVAERIRQYETNAPALEEWFANFDLVRTIDATASVVDLYSAVEAQIQDVMKAKETAAVGIEEGEALPGLKKKNVADVVEHTIMVPTGGEDGAAKIGGVSPTGVPVRKDLLDLSSTAHFARFYDVGLAQVLAAQWLNVEEQYTARVKGALRVLRDERRSNLTHFATVRTNFVTFLKRADQMGALTTQFQTAFNSVHADLRADNQAKDELHLRADELGDALLAALQRKQHEAENELRDIRTSGHVPARMDALAACYVVFVQAELDRYLASVRIVQDFFTALKGGVIYEDPQPATITLPGLQTVQHRAKGKSHHPRTPTRTTRPGNKSSRGRHGWPQRGHAGDLSKLKSGGDAMALQDVLKRVEEAVDVALSHIVSPDQAVAEVNGDAAAKQRGGRAIAHKAKRRKSIDMAPVIDRTKQNFADMCDAQIRLTVRLEALVLQQRLHRLDLRCTNEVGALQKYANEVFDARLDELLGLRVKGESVAIDRAISLIKAAVEREEPLHQVLRLEGESAYLDNDALVVPFRTLPEVNSSSECNAQGAFSAGQLTDLAASLRSLPRIDGTGFCAEVDGVANILYRRARLQYGGDEISNVKGMPASWISLTETEICERVVLPMASVLGAGDGRGAGASHGLAPSPFRCIDWRRLVVALSLQGHPGLIPSLADLRAGVDACAAAAVASSSNLMLSWEAFSNVRMWFEKPQDDGDGSEGDVPVVNETKKLYFSVFSNNSGRVNFVDLLLHLCFSDSNIDGRTKAVQVAKHAARAVRDFNIAEAASFVHASSSFFALPPTIMK